MKNTSLSLDTNYLYEKQNHGHFIAKEIVKVEADFVAQSIAKVEENIAVAQYDFIEVLKEKSYLKSVHDVHNKLKWADYLVVVGIGGSDLGGRTIVEAFNNKDNKTKVIFTGDSTDPVSLKRTLEQINLKKTVFNIISKSGGTLETLSNYLFYKAQVKKIASDWQKHFVFTTSGVSGLLKDEAEHHKIITLPVPEKVGGRFSVLSPVGLLPALVAGVDIKDLIQGGLDFANSDETRKIAQEFARSQYELYQQGIKVCVIMTYSVQLQEFARWFRQLWAESLGKDNKGILPIKAWGPADQHSQAQFYNQGSPISSLLFIKINKREINFTLKGIDIPQAEYLEGVDFNQIINIEADASAQSLYNNGRPNATLSVEELTSYSLGELFMLFELAVVYLAQMLGVNAFDQPGVEAGKVIIKQKITKI